MEITSSWHPVPFSNSNSTIWVEVIPSESNNMSWSCWNTWRSKYIRIWSLALHAKKQWINNGALPPSRLYELCACSVWKSEVKNFVCLVFSEVHSKSMRGEMKTSHLKTPTWRSNCLQVLGSWRYVCCPNKQIVIPVLIPTYQWDVSDALSFSALINWHKNVGLFAENYDPTKRDVWRNRNWIWYHRPKGRSWQLLNWKMDRENAFVNYIEQSPSRRLELSNLIIICTIIWNTHRV